VDIERQNTSLHITPNILPHVEAALARARVLAEGFDGVGAQAARDHAQMSV